MAVIDMVGIPIPKHIDILNVLIGHFPYSYRYGKMIEMKII